MDSILFAVILLPKSSHKVQTVLFFVKNSLHFEQVTRSIQKIWWTHLILYLLKDIFTPFGHIYNSIFVNLKTIEILML